tara:strand:- start:239 stop:550 length:312 start_codon:yes stop_codon:yes gene_type:complete
MTKKQTLKFTIRQDGYVTEEVMGTVSNECVKLTEQIENKLGSLEKRVFKPDHYLAQPVDNFWASQDVEVQNNQPVPEWRKDYDIAVKTALDEQDKKLRNRLEN